jgi:hypothetical protein
VWRIAGRQPGLRARGADRRRRHRPVRRGAQFDSDDGHFFFRRRLAEVLGALVVAMRV